MKIFIIGLMSILTTSAFSDNTVICKAIVKSNSTTIKEMVNKPDTPINNVTASIGNFVFDVRNKGNNGELTGVSIMDFTDGRSLFINRVNIGDNGLSEFYLIAAHNQDAIISCKKF